MRGDAPLGPIHILTSLPVNGVGVNYSEHGEAALFKQLCKALLGAPSVKHVKRSKPVSIFAFSNQETKEGKEITPTTRPFLITKKPSSYILKTLVEHFVNHFSMLMLNINHTSLNSHSFIPISECLLCVILGILITLGLQKNS